MTFAELQIKHASLFALRCASFCPQGWIPLLRRLCEQLEERCPETRFVQIKEKFGELRVYTEGSDDEADRLIDAAESVSRTTCEVCGGLATQHVSPSGWISTLCEDDKP